MQEDLIKMRQASAQVGKAEAAGHTQVATAAETPVLRPCPSRLCMHACIHKPTACTSHTVPLLPMFQVMASQKQMEAKFKQAQATAVSVVDTNQPQQCSWRTHCSVSACQLWPTLWLPRASMHSPIASRHNFTQQVNSTMCCCTLTPPQDDWLKRAELAVSKGEDELAREALKRRKAYQVSQDSKQWGRGLVAQQQEGCSGLTNEHPCVEAGGRSVPGRWWSHQPLGPQTLGSTHMLIALAAVHPRM